MPAVKHKAKKAKKAKTKRTKPRKAAAKTAKTRHATGHCKGECRLRTKGMKVGDVRRRIHGKKKLKIIRVA